MLYYAMGDEIEKPLNNTEHISPSAEHIFNTATLLSQELQVDPDLFGYTLESFGDEYENEEQLNLLSQVVPAILQNPTTPSDEVQTLMGISREQLLDVYKWIQSSNMLREVMTSHYYPGYMMIRYAQSFLGDLAKDPQYLKDVIEKKPISPKRLEVHVTNAACNYRCTMCLWHVDNQAKYDTDKDILSVEEWKDVLDQASEGGTGVVIFSGGGEPLLRSDTGEVIEHANKRGLYTMIYTNGSNLEKLPQNGKLYQSILNSNWLRVSLHATDEERYADLVHLPRKTKPLSRVILGIKRLIRDRDELGKPLQIGVGFVVQHENYDQVLDIVKLSQELGVDMLNIREDCIDITQNLNDQEKGELYNSLKEIRRNIDLGNYGDMSIDFADSMIGPMNNWDRIPNIETSEECKVHLYRSAIDPYGRVATCDLVSEPFFASDDFTLGYVSDDKNYVQVLEESADKEFDATKCSKCMPGQQAINALWYKVLRDYEDGIEPQEQPLLFLTKKHGTRRLQK